MPWTELDWWMKAENPLGAAKSEISPRSMRLFSLFQFSALLPAAADFSRRAPETKLPTSC